MEVGIALLAGMVIGWLIEWVIDWQYWRRGVAGFYSTETELRSELAKTEAELQESTAALAQTQSELSTARAQVQAAKVRQAELQRRLDAEQARTTAEITASAPATEKTGSPAPAASRPVHSAAPADDLTKIKGVGPTFEQRMREAGVTTFVQVAEATPEELEHIVQPAAWQRIDFADWRQQAKNLAAQPAAAVEGQGA